MHYKKRNRLIAILIIMATCAAGVYIILSNLNDNIVFFYPPSELNKIKSHPGKVRIGGIVKNNSVKKGDSGKIAFILTDYKKEIEVNYEGLLPALFREGQGIVAEGRLVSDNLFAATRLLAKHDENYMPPTNNPS